MWGRQICGAMLFCFGSLPPGNAGGDGGEGDGGDGNHGDGEDDICKKIMLR